MAGTDNTIQIRGAWIAVSEESIDDRAISDGAHRLLAKLLTVVFKEGRAMPSVEEMAAWKGVSSRTIQNLLKELEAADYMIIVPRTDKRTGAQISNHYLVFQDAERCRHAKASGEFDPTQRPENDGRKSSPVQNPAPGTPGEKSFTPPVQNPAPLYIQDSDLKILNDHESSTDSGKE